MMDHMKMKTGILSLLIAVLAAAVFPAEAFSAPEVSEWLLQVRSTEEYLQETADGYVTSATPYDESFVWIMEAAGPETVRIRNKATGSTLALSSGGALSPSGDCDRWTIGGFGISQMRNAGWYTFSSGWADTKVLLGTEKSHAVCVSADKVRSYSVQWTPVRLNGSRIPYELTGDSVVESSFMGERHATALSTTSIFSDWHGGESWELEADISRFPRFSSEGNVMIPALYNMALEEMLLDIRKDSTFMAGALWPDTWTRDAVYSIWFSYSWLLPDISRKTLEKQTLRDPSEALQDTGSGGSWPISTDRVVWALAAWEYYLVTGDRDWLAGAYEGLANTARKDLHVAFDPDLHLFRGETCSMDWRTHTYPNWFTNANIGESFSSGTNALHLFLYRFLSDAGSIIGAPQEDIDLWNSVEKSLKSAFNGHFWDSRKGLYSCWLYPAFMDYLPSDKTGVMSNGLAAVCGAASRDQIESIVSNYPLYPYGASVIYPTKPDGFAYHNKGIWPVWQTPLMYAAKDVRNTAVLSHLMQSMTRAAALFLTHKENMTYDTGYDRNTALNSDRQLWSVASYISMVYRVLFGMEISREGLRFNPVVPSFAGSRLTLEGFRYRDAEINVTVRGNGDSISSLTVNGRKRKAGWYLPYDAHGKYNIEISMADSGRDPQANITAAGPGSCWAPVEPVVHMENGMLMWTEIPGVTYWLVGNGQEKQVCPPCDLNGLPDGYYSIYAADDRGFCSDLSNPVLKTSWTAVYEAEDSVPENVSSDGTGFSGRGYVKDYGSCHKDLAFEFDLPHDGDYVLYFTGANGHGPHATYCTVRSVYLDGEDYASLILEAYGDWNVWTSTNHMILKGMKQGKHQISIRFNPEDKGFDNNMSFNEDNLNDWHIDKMTISAL